MAPVCFGIVGGGWRAEFYLRIAEALPERFRVSGMLVRNQQKGEAIEERWGVKTHRTMDELLKACSMRFVVVAASRTANGPLTRELASRDVPVLVETPPAYELSELIALHELTERGAKVQVAEQYIFQPLHAARLAVISSGWLGAVTQAQISAAHGYHGVCLIRHHLGVKFEEARILARSFESRITAGPGRKGPPEKEETTSSAQTIAYLDFGDKLGVYDFAGAQYFSWIRSTRVLVRGERGEINNKEVRYLADFRTPVTLELRRMEAGEGGNLEGYHLKGILAGSEWLYRNPFIPARLADEEIAIATCLEKMDGFVSGGPGFYSLPEASQDAYLALMIEKALETGETVSAGRQPWASA